MRSCYGGLRDYIFWLTKPEEPEVVSIPDRYYEYHLHTLRMKHEQVLRQSERLRAQYVMKYLLRKPEVVEPVPEPELPAFDYVAEFWQVLATYEQQLQIAGLFVGACLVFLVLSKLAKLITKLYTRVPHSMVKSCVEKMRPGSYLEYAATKPLFQVEIWIRTDGLFMKTGQGFNTKFGLITALHVVEEAVEIKLVSERGELIVDASRFKQVEGDVGLLRLTANETATLGVEQAKLASHQLNKKAGLFVKVQAFGQQTMGMLSPDDDAFGFCDYNGSTVKGFSGAPYYLGKAVYGMHVGGTTKNFGYEAAYIYMLVSRGQESTEDYLISEIQKDVDYHWQPSPYNPDEIRMRVNGKFYLVDQDEFDKIVGKSKKAPKRYHAPTYEKEALTVTDETIKAEDLPLAPRAACSYQDVELPKNDQSLAQPGFVNAPVIGEQVQIPVQNQANQMCYPMVYQYPQFLAPYPTAGPSTTRAQRNVASPNTPKLTRGQKVQRRIAKAVSEAMQEWQRQQATQHGRQISQEPPITQPGSTNSSSQQ